MVKTFLPSVPTRIFVLPLSLLVSYHKIWLPSSLHPAHVTMVFIHPLSKFSILLYEVDFKKFCLIVDTAESPLLLLAASSGRS